MVPLWWVSISHSDLAILQTYEEPCLLFQVFACQYLLEKKKQTRNKATQFFRTWKRECRDHLCTSLIRNIKNGSDVGRLAFYRSAQLLVPSSGNKNSSVRSLNSHHLKNWASKLKGKIHNSVFCFIQKILFFHILICSSKDKSTKHRGTCERPLKVIVLFGLCRKVFLAVPPAARSALPETQIKGRT